MTKKMKSLGLLALAIGIVGNTVFAQTKEEIRSIADKEADYVLSEMERMKGKAIMLPEVVAQLGVIRYAEATNNQKLIDRVVALYKAAYLEDGCLNRLTYGHIESQATAIIPLELYRITGDKSLLKDCWRVVQGQMRNPQKGGIYRHATWKGDDLFVILFLQNAAHRVYGQQECLDFVKANLDGYNGKKPNISDKNPLSLEEIVSLSTFKIDKSLFSSKWKNITENHKTREQKSWNIISVPLYESGNILLCGSALLDYTPKNNKTEIIQLKSVSDSEISETLKVYEILRNAEVEDDLKTIEKIQSDFKFDEKNPLDPLIAMELYRLTGNSDYERECIAILNDLLVEPLKNKDLNSLLLAQGFKVYGTQKFANSAKIKLNDSPLLKNLNIPTNPTDPTDPIDPTIRAEDIYKLGMSSNDAKSATANSAKLRELCNKLQAKTGFFKHCETSKGLCFSRVSGQAIYGIVNLLKNLPKNNANSAFFVRKIKDMAYALERNQSQNGLWHILPEDFNSPQDSLSSAFFIATLAIALEQKWIHRLEYRDILDLGWKGVQSKIENGKLTSVAPACEPRKISSAYALLKQVTGDALSVVALNDATFAIKSYYASDVPGSEEDKMAVLGSMNEITAYAYEGKLPDGRILKHISTQSHFEITQCIVLNKKMEKKLLKEYPDVYTENDFRMGDQILDEVKLRALPDAIKKLRYPVGGITVWLKDNPSVHIVSSDLGYCILSRSYVPLAKNSKTATNINQFQMMAQIPGFKPLPISTIANKNSLLVNLAKEIDNTTYSKVPEGPSDKISGKLLAPIVLNHHRAERKELLAMLGKKVIEIPIDDAVIIRPVYLCGKIVSTVDGKPIDEANAWLKRNPFLIHNACEDGEFEVLGKDVALYEHTNDSLMINAPGFKAKEVALKSYMDDDINIKLDPRNYKPIIQCNTTLPMVKIPSGFFRMGQGLWEKYQLLSEDSINGFNQPDGRDTARRNCWPIQTVSVPSFYFCQYNFSNDFKNEIFDWAMENGYFTIIGRKWTFSFTYPIMLNAMSERDGFTPCYYTADLKIIRTDEDISENLICNWKADGYRLPTWAEWIYASRAGRTRGLFFGNDCDKYRDYYICSKASQNFEGVNSLSSNSFARRIALDWGIYGTILGQRSQELLNDFMFWRHNNSYHPRGPSLRESRYIDRLHLGGRTCVGQFHMGIIDSRETQWYDKWLGNPIGFQFSGWGNHLDNGTFFGLNTSSIGLYARRVVRTAENICNDINLVKTKNDPTLKSPKPVKLNTVTEKLDMLPVKGGEFSMGAAFTGNKFIKYSKFSIGSPRPEHEVTVSDFSASRFEITVQQWRTVLEWAKSNGYSDLPEGSLGKSSSEDLRHPVVDITWFDVLKWCNAVSEKQNLNPCYTIDGNIFKAGIPDDENIVCDWKANGYRLPTEAEWEYAEQAGSDACWYWGDDAGNKYCWRGEGKIDSNTGGTSHPVGQKYGNLFGLYDTIGNVWEWCWDIKTPHTMNLNTPINPKGASKKALKDYLAGVNKKGKEATCIGDIKWYKGNRTLKGGAYNTHFGYHSYQCSQFRVSCSPEKSDDSIGFRVVRGK